MPLPLTVSCFSKIQIAFTFLVPAHLVVPDKGPLAVCVCVCVTVADACLIGVLATAEAVRKSKLTQAACDANVERASRAWLAADSERSQRRHGRRQREV